MNKQVTSAAVDLPGHLDLPLPSGRPYWYRLGGSPSVDLVNTLRERWSRRVECITGPSDLAGWLAWAGLAPDGAAATGGQVTAARDLRECVDGLLTAAVEGRAADAAAVAHLDGCLARWAPRPGLAVGAGGAPASVEHGPADPVDAALGLLALDAAAILGGPRRERLRICAAPDCSARFLDTSPAGRRRWCSMSGCGNRAKVRRHRSRA